MLQDIILPSVPLVNFPNLVLPTAPSITVPSLAVDPKTIQQKEIKVNIGGTLMKLKLFLGFTQCVSFFPITFSSIPFPLAFINLSNYLELLSCDFLSVFGSAACNLVTGFYQQFQFSYALLPAVLCCTLISYGIALALHKKTSNYTKESAATRLYSLLFMVIYSLYTGVSTKLFRLFKCIEIQDQHYLTADYSVTCYDNNYKTHVAFAVVGMLIFTLGIPLFILHILIRNKKYLHKSKCPEHEMYKHLKVEKEYGSIYSDYTEDNYFFDLLDLGRRLLLTGALIMVGLQSNTQIFLGALLCLLWLLVVTVRRPYVAYWDNVLSIVLSLQLVLIMLCGMALEMNRLTPDAAADPYEAIGFSILMVTFSIAIIATAVFAIFVSIPCIRDPLIKRWIRCCTKKEKNNDEDTEDESMNNDKTEEEKENNHVTIKLVSNPMNSRRDGDSDEEKNYSDTMEDAGIQIVI